MIEENLLREVLVGQKQTFLNKKNLFQREVMANFYQKYSQLKEIIFITGLRRCGKSSLLKLIWDDFKKRNSLSNEQFLYLNFEDERLVHFDEKDFSKILEAYYQLYSPSKNKKIWLFLDEIQNIPYWEKWLNRIYEEGKYKIFITGSNATLLSSELAATLTGRNISVDLHPLSFYEYHVFFKKNPLIKKSFFDLEEKAKIKKNLDSYLLLGGMPEYLKTKSEELMQEYFKNIILRDISTRYNIKYKRELKELAHFLLANIGQILSLQKISRAVQIKNISTVKNYLEYLESSFLFSSLPLFSFSYKKQIYNPKKIYCVDAGFFNTISFRTSKNIGNLLENIVFLELQRDDKEIFYYKTKSGKEVDFLVKNKEQIESLIQVSFALESKQTITREESSLLEAMEELGLKSSFLINNQIEKKKLFKDKEINYIPFWKWALGNRI